MKRGLLALVVLVVAGLILLLLRAPTEEPVASGEPAPVAAKRTDGAKPSAFSEAAPSPSADAPRALDAEESGCRIRVIDSRGAALAGVRVDVTWKDPKAVQPYAFATTDADGRAFVPGPLGPYELVANGTPELPAFGPAWREVVLEPGSTTDFVLVLPDADSRLVVFVHDEKGAGIEGVALRAHGNSATASVGKAEGQTDATGRVMLAPIVAGLWRVSVRKAPDRFTLPKEAEARVDVGAATEASVEITLPSKATLNVDLSDPALAAQLAEISIASANPSRKSWPFKEAQVSWQLAPGDWTVATQWKEDCAQWAEPQTVTLAAGEVRTITPKLVAGVASLSGRILDRRGVPVELAGVHVNAVRPPSATEPGAKLTEKIARSDANGVWHLVGLPAGQASVFLELRASKQRYLADDMAPYRSFELMAGSRELPEFLVDPGIALRVHLSDEWLAKSKDIEVEAAFGPDAAAKNARRRRLSRKDDAFVFDHGAIDAYALRILDKQGHTLATAAFTVDPSAAEGATVDATPDFTSP